MLNLQELVTQFKRDLPSLTTSYSPVRIRGLDMPNGGDNRCCATSENFANLARGITLTPLIDIDALFGNRISQIFGNLEQLVTSYTWQ